MSGQRLGDMDSDALTGRDDTARSEIAQRVGQVLSGDDMSQADRVAAELVAWKLLDDAVERVRFALANAVKHAQHLPMRLALKIVHDVDSIACPFLETTEIFSDEDWAQLLLTISRGARIAVARRSSMTESIAKNLLQSGDAVVAEVLVENPAATMSDSVFQILMDRFSSQIWILDKLAMRDDLLTEIAVQLTLHVSAAAREKLSKCYNIPDQADRLSIETEQNAIFELVKNASDGELVTIARTLNKERKLTPRFLLSALEEDQNAFFEVALSVLGGGRLGDVQGVMRTRRRDAVLPLLEKSGIPQPMRNAFWHAFQIGRRRKNLSAS